VYNGFGLWLSDGFVLPPDGTDSPKQYVFMKQSRASCTSDDTVNVYQADTQEVSKLAA
jgi:hypothetical protein